MQPLICCGGSGKRVDVLLYKRQYAISDAVGMSKGFGRLELKIIKKLHEDERRLFWQTGIDEWSVQNLGRDNRIEKQGLVRAMRSLIRKRVLINYMNGNNKEVWGLRGVIEKKYPDRIVF